MQNLNDFKMLEEKTASRYWSSLPLCAYSKKNWLDFFRYVYWETTGGQSYEIPNIVGEMSCLQTAYMKVFSKRQWSAREFARFLVHSVTKSAAKSDYIFTIRIFHRPKYIDGILDVYDKKLRTTRDQKELEGKVYMPFYPLTAGQDDLYAVFDITGDEIIPLCYNYGIPNFVKYLQIRHKISLPEAIDLFKGKFSELLSEYKNHKPLLRDYLSGFAKSSLLWEPYTTRKQREQFGEDTLVINWRREMGKLWDHFELPSEPWWKNKSETYKEKRIAAVKDLFE